MEKISIRFAKKRDAKALLSIYSWYAINTDVAWDKSVPSLKHFKEKLESISKTYPYVLCQIGSEIVGYAYVCEHEDSIGEKWTTIYIADNYRGYKIGKALYTCIFEITTLQGIERIRAISAKHNRASIKFHESFGFCEVGTYPGAVILEKRLLKEAQANEPAGIDTIDKQKISKAFSRAQGIIEKVMAT